MAEMTIGQARDSFSSLIANLLNGTVQEYVIKNRDTPVARIVPIASSAGRLAGFGIARDSPFVMDDDIFDALDDEIAEEFVS